MAASPRAELAGLARVVEVAHAVAVVRDELQQVEALAARLHPHVPRRRSDANT